MIINELKPCCDECGDIEGYFDTEKLQCMTGEKKAISRICCEHQAVCKKYIECVSIPKLPKGGVFKGEQLPFIE